MIDDLKLIKYIILLREQDFEGWTLHAEDGYKTALVSIECKIKELLEKENDK